MRLMVFVTSMTPGTCFRLFHRLTVSGRSGLILFLVFFTFSPASHALAGIGERTSRFYYNDYAGIERGHPSDLCHGQSKWCLKLRRHNERNFKDIDSVFEEMNIPTNPESPYLIGRRSTDNVWVVYDLQQERVLFMGDKYNKAIEFWRSLGLQTPVFVNAHNTREFLQETRDSVISRWSFDLQMWLFNALLLLVPPGFLFWYLGRKSEQRYRTGGSRLYRILSWLLLLPVLILIYTGISSLLHIILYNW